MPGLSPRIIGPKIQTSAGGRIIGEVCHFVDLLRYLTGTSITGVNSSLLVKDGPQDTLSVTLNFADGSLGTIHYFANGNKAFPKERLEIFGSGRVLQLDNFRQLHGFGWPGFKKMNLWRQDKGHEAEIQAFVEAVQAGAASPIPFEEIVEVTRITLKSRITVNMPLPRCIGDKALVAHCVPSPTSSARFTRFAIGFCRRV